MYMELHPSRIAQGLRIPSCSSRAYYYPTTWCTLQTSSQGILRALLPREQLLRPRSSGARAKRRSFVLSSRAQPLFGLGTLSVVNVNEHSPDSERASHRKFRTKEHVLISRPAPSRVSYLIQLPVSPSRVPTYIFFSPARHVIFITSFF